METEVLIVGAGPTGLVLAIWLARLGIKVRILDKTAEPGTTSRALAVQARTLEIYRQLGFAQDVVKAGLELAAVNLWAEGKKAAHIAFGQQGVGQSPFPYGLIYPQDEHERFLSARLEELGVRVERETELVDFEETGEGVVARLKDSTCVCAFLAGCDGAHSTVRQKLGIGFPGGTYEHLFYVADVEASGPLMDRELHVSVDESDFAAVFPLKEQGRARLIGTIRPEAERDREGLGWDDVSKGLLQRLRVDVQRVNWFSTYHVHHRVASRFRQGRAFLLGDAAHIHSPVGGQGMNTGIGDAVNLAWKLAAVLRGRARAGILDSYEPERIAFARRLVATTDRVFQFISRRGSVAAQVRVHVVPRALSALFRLDALRRLMFRIVSQTAIDYRDSDLSTGHAGRIHGGDRLPWVRSEPDNFSLLASLDWQLHVYGAATPELAGWCAAQGLPLHVIPWSQSAARAGLARNASYLVRPDGHVALADPSQNPVHVQRYLDALGVRFVATRRSLMSTVQVRYIVHDVDAAIAFYCQQLGFQEVMHPAPAFAMLSRGDLRLVLSAPNPSAGGGQPMPDGRQQEPGGWNRFAIEVDDLAAMVERLRSSGAHFRNDIVTGVGGKQILLEDPSGNPIELFQPIIAEARLAQPARG